MFDVILETAMDMYICHIIPSMTIIFTYVFDNLYFHISLLNIQRVSNTKINYASLECVIQNDEIVYTCIMYRSCLLDSYHIC